MYLVKLCNIVLQKLKHWMTVKKTQGYKECYVYMVYLNTIEF